MIALLLWLFLAPPPPAFSALWAGNHTARLSWTQPADIALTCLYRQTTLLRCWPNLPAGATSTLLGDRGPLDAAAHPQPNDLYTLTLDEEQRQTRLGWQLWLAQIRR